MATIKRRPPGVFLSFYLVWIVLRIRHIYFKTESFEAFLPSIKPLAVPKCDELGVDFYSHVIIS
jgi:hypothetical protein